MPLYGSFGGWGPYLLLIILPGHIDLSAGSGANAISRDLSFGREFLIRRADQLLFGTDFLMIGQTVAQFELLDSFELPDDVQRRIFRDNARKLLKLS